MIRSQIGEQSVFDALDGPTVRDAVTEFGHQFAGFGFLNVHQPNSRFVALMGPHWLVIVVLAIVSSLLALGAIRSHRRALRIKRGLCFRCGYDVRATRDRCPECGAAVAQSAEGNA